MPIVLTFREASIEVFEDSTRITLPSGATIHAAPEDTPEYRATALANGYDTDLKTLCFEHEVAHLALGDLLGAPSPTMEFLGDHKPAEAWLREMEEDAVLAIQRYSRALGIDLVHQLQQRHVT